jgi:hypothetical protein
MKEITKLIIQIVQENVPNKSNSTLIKSWELIQIDLENIDETSEEYKLLEPINNTIEVELEKRNFEPIEENQVIKQWKSL